MLSVDAFLVKAGLDEPLAPGEVKFRPIIGEKEGTSYTLKYDWKDPQKLRIEVIPGLTGKHPDAKELKNYAVWLQSPSAIEIAVKDGERIH